MGALILPMRKWGINPAEVSYDDYDDWQRAAIKIGDFKVRCPFKTLIVDSLTSMGDNVNRQTRTSKIGGTTKDGQAAGKNIGGIRVNTMDDYNAEAAAFQDMIADLKHIAKYHGVKVVLIAHVVGQRKSEPDNNLTHHSRIIITGGEKISGKIPAYCTETYHFNVETGASVNSDLKYCLYTTHTGNDFARTALPLERRIEFGDKPLYKTWIEPAIARLTKGE